MDDQPDAPAVIQFLIIDRPVARSTKYLHMWQRLALGSVLR
jgi:hypothetical protein